jgi:hypothetical protein
MKIETSKLRQASWFGGTVFTNPTSGTVLADTGARSEASPSEGTEYEWMLLASTTASARIVVAHRNATDTADVASFSVLLPAGVVAFPVFARLFQNQRVKVTLGAAITGDISVALLQVRAYD